MRKIIPVLLGALSLSLFSCSSTRDSRVVTGDDGIHSAVAQGELEYETTDKAIDTANNFCQDRHDRSAVFMYENEDQVASNMAAGTAAPGVTPPAAADRNKIGSVIAADEQVRVTVRFKCV